MGFQEIHHEEEAEEEECGKVTSVMGSSIIVRIGSRKRVLECTTEILRTVEDCIPCKRKLTIKGNVVLSCSKLNE